MHYKSYLRCDDPKGVVECTPFKRSLLMSDKMEIKSKSHKMMMQKKPDANSAEKREILPQETRNESSSSSSSSFQLMQISRGAQKMNSWSKGLESKTHSKEVAKDLLRGALDLQESLLMLGKLREASHSMAKLKNKQNERSGVLRIDGITERASSARFGDRKYPIQLQESNFLADSSSKDSIEELKRVIRESLAKHNLLPSADSEEETFSSGTLLDSDLPSTSSSQSSTAYGSYFSSSNSLLPMAPPRIAAKGPSLIAKLMGLEDMPSKPLQKALKKPFQMEKMPGFDIDIPQLRKPRFIMPTEEQKPRRLEDILESMHFKGLLKSSSMKDAKSHILYSNDSFDNHSFIHEDPPIVVIKPFSHPWLQTRDPFMLASGDKEQEEDWSTETIPRKLKAKDEPVVKTSDGKEIKQLSHQRLQTRKPSVCVSKEEEALKAETMPKKLKVKDEPLFKRNDRKEDVLLSSSRPRRIAETNVNSTKRHDHEGGCKDGRERGLKAEVKEPMTENRLPVKMKTSGTTIQKVFKKNEVDKKPDKMPAKTTGKSTEKRISKVRSLSSSHERAELPAPEAINHEKGMTKIQSFQHQTAKSSSTSTSEMATRVHPNGDRLRSSTKKGKITSKHKEYAAKIESVRSRENDKRTEQPSADESSPTNDCIVTVDQRLADIERTEPLDTEIEVPIEQCCGSQSPIHNITELTAEDSAVVIVIEEIIDDNIIPPNISQGAVNVACLRALLLSDQEFLNHVEDFFDLDVTVLNVSPKESIIGQADNCRRLSLDCAKEFIERRSYPESQMLHPGSLVSVPSMKIKIPLHRLLEEVCNGVETMRSYGDVNTHQNPCDNLSSMLERDMKHKEVSSSIWDLGWRNTFSADDAMHVVNELEDRLLRDLINEILV